MKEGTSVYNTLYILLESTRLFSPTLALVVYTASAYFSDNTIYDYG